MELSAKGIFEAIASKIENECRLPAENLKSLKATAQALAKQSKYFSLLEVDCLIRQFYILLGQESMIAKPIPGMDKQEFAFILQTFFGIDTKIMINRMFATLDVNKDGHIGVEEWVESLGVFLRGDLDEKSLHTFQAYDLNSDKCISKEEIFFLLKKGDTTKDKSDQDLEDLLDLTFRQADQDHDGYLSCPDFQKTVQKSSMYLQAFGKCLPDPSEVAAFEDHLTELKRIVKAKGKRELNIPQKSCFLSLSSANPVHKPLPTETQKLSGFLPSALRLAHLPPPSPICSDTHFTYPVKTRGKSAATTRGSTASTSHKPI
ncbi:hypothetical protein WMY93_015997 [Mugilogobius chulae]|uniref:EF-hand domain-containing protein n=1 Tax=Mugilogobius chulae TaxID=88201 RepID=A0AAW0NS81_9GOBI